MELNRTRFALEKTKAALNCINEDKDTISIYFTEYILIIFCAEMEEKVKDSLEEVLNKDIPESLTCFISNTLESIIKRTKKSDIVDTIKKFGDEKKALFNSLLDDAMIQKYTNLITNRHKVAHPGENQNCSWSDIQDAADIGETVLQAFRKSLGL